MLRPSWLYATNKSSEYKTSLGMSYSSSICRHLPALKVSNRLGVKGYLIGFVREKSNALNHFNYFPEANIHKPYVLWAESLVPVETTWNEIELDPDDLIERFFTEDVCILLKKANIYTVGMLQFLSRGELRMSLNTKGIEKVETVLSLHGIELRAKKSRKTRYFKELSRSERAMNEAHDIDAELFKLKQQGLKNGEIAALKNMSAGRVSQRIQRYLRRMDAG